MPVLVPPIKCQGIKTKLVPAIRSVAGEKIAGRWIEPFCGSGVVAFNLCPDRALLSDANQHIITFYQQVQTGQITPGIVADYLRNEGGKLRDQGEGHYYAVRARFNEVHAPLDFLFLNRACFNGVIRFNRKGGFNTPFCRKPERFAPAYVTKIVNQVRAAQEIIQSRDWTFVVSDFQQTLSQATSEDLVYADPPYQGRHTDYFGTWSESDAATLIRLLKHLPCSFILSTWQENRFRRNPDMDAHWSEENLHILSLEHFYHVGSQETLRHSITEALISNRPACEAYQHAKPQQFALELLAKVF